MQGHNILLYLLFHTGCSENCVFFPIHCNPSPSHRRANHVCKRSKCTITPVGWTFSVQPIGAQVWRRTMSRSNPIFPGHPVPSLYVCHGSQLPEGLFWVLVFVESWFAASYLGFEQWRPQGYILCISIIPPPLSEDSFFSPQLKT